MIPILYNAVTEGTVPNDYGIGSLTDCLSCEVTEERNGSYELTLSYAVGGIHADEIEVNRIIKAKPNYTDNPQLFRIYKVGKAMNGRFEVNAQHISYDLSGKIITTGTASSCVSACSLLQTQAGNFTITTDKTVSASFKITEPSSVRSWFGGKAGSLLDVFGSAEWSYDNYSCVLNASRGQDRGVQIRYGKNLTELSQVMEMSNLATGIIPYYKDPDGNVTTGTKVPTGLSLDVTRDIAIDFSSGVNPDSGTAIATQLANLATKYKNNNNLTVPFKNITLDFVQLQNLSERVDLCDTVHIFFEPLGISASAKCIATTWDVLDERYTRTSFGDAKTNIADVISSAQKTLTETPSTSYMNQAINRATELITGNLGGYVILHDSDGNGEPDEILIMNTPDIATATQVWRWNKNGLGYATSYAGPYGTAITSDGKIVANYVSTGTLNADLIKAGTIEDVGHNSAIDMTTGEAKLNNLKAKLSFQLLGTTSNVKASLNHMGTDGAQFLLYDNSNHALVDLWAHNGDGSIQLNNSSGYQRVSLGGDLLRMQTSSGTAYIDLGLGTNGASLSLRNSSGGERITERIANGGGGYIGLYNAGGDNQTIYANGTSGNITCVSLTQTSSRKVKENIKPIEDSEKILDLQAVSFDFKDKAKGTNKRGFIAEDVAEVLPNIVTPEEDGKPASINYVEMIPYLQDVIKKQEERIKVLEEKISNLGG